MALVVTAVAESGLANQYSRYMFRECGMLQVHLLVFLFAWGTFALFTVVAGQAPAAHGSRDGVVGNLKTTHRACSAQIQENGFSGDGTLSYAVARGCEGVADSDGPGVRTVQMPWTYLLPIVRTRFGFHQGRGLLAVAANGGMAEPHLAKHDDAHTGLPEFGRVTLSWSATVEPGAPSGATLLEDKSKAELVYDGKGRRVLNSTGNILAFDVDPADIENVVRTRQLLKAMEALADREGLLDVSLSTVDRLYVKGARVMVQVDGEPYNYLTVFDVTANGRMTLLYPLVNAPFSDSLETHSSRPLPPIEVDEPFGADYVVAIRSEKPLDSLLGAFSRERSYHLAISDGITAMRRAMMGVAVRVGVQAIYTCAQLTAEGQCASP